MNGCFWHRHKNCKYVYSPKSRIEFWEKKFEANVKRDLDVRQKLYSQNIKVLTVWECTIKLMKKNDTYEKEILEKTVAFLNSDEMYLEL